MEVLTIHPAKESVLCGMDEKNYIPRHVSISQFVEVYGVRLRVCHDSRGMECKYVSEENASPSGRVCHYPNIPCKS